MTASASKPVVALAGGVGGAKLIDGLAQILGNRLTAVVNTGDDFRHLGFHISPDLDTVMYTLAGIANPETGWGVADETWSFMEQLIRLGGPTWFKLGDRDLATHAIRTEALRGGEPLSTITSQLCRALGIDANIVPMTDDDVRTIVKSGAQRLAFQDYFVRLRTEVPVTGLSFEGAVTAKPPAALADLMRKGAIEAIVIGPSNPYLSIDPILGVPALRAWIEGSEVPVVAVSPIVGGAAIKGPAAKIMRELGFEPSALTVAQHYKGLISGLVIDEVDAALTSEIESAGIRVRVTPTIMRNAQDRRRVAQECLAFAEALTPA
jgi:LPPG:FO 2-phospho-L-lactate transferase